VASGMKSRGGEPQLGQIAAGRLAKAARSCAAADDLPFGARQSLNVDGIAKFIHKWHMQWKQEWPGK